jgi:hypothetical protein
MSEALTIDLAIGISAVAILLTLFGLWIGPP